MGKYIVLFFLIAFTGIPSYADEIKDVSFGNITPKIDTPANAVLAEKNIILALNTCVENNCETRIRWEPIGNIISSWSGSKKFLFTSNVPGIGIEADISLFKLANRQEIIFRLFKLSAKNGTGSFNNGLPLLKWYLEKKEKGDWKVTETGIIRVDGSLHAGTCSPIQGDLQFNIRPVSLNMLKNLRIGEKLPDFADHQSISIRCTPGVAENFSVRFNGEYYQGTPWILKGSNDIGFIAEVTVNDSLVLWNGSESYDGPIPESGRVDIPLTVYYAKAGENIRGGEVHARGQFIMSYR